MLVNDAKDLLVEPTHGHASQEIVLVIIFKFDTIHHGGDLVQDQLVVAAEQYLELMNNYLKWSEKGRMPTKRRGESLAAMSGFGYLKYHATTHARR